MQTFPPYRQPPMQFPGPSRGYPNGWGGQIETTWPQKTPEWTPPAQIPGVGRPYHESSNGYPPYKVPRRIYA